MDSVDMITEDTLPDDAWKDSFDKLLDQRPILRELNVLKRDIRASFNMNSSYENSGYDISSSLKNDCEQVPLPVKTSTDPSKLSVPRNYIDVPSLKKVTNLIPVDRRTDIISTPVKNDITSNPFKCTLSPIGPWELRNFTNNKNNDKYNNVFNATPVVDKALEDVEFIEDINTPTVPNEENKRYTLGISPLVLVRNKWKSKQQQVRFATKELDVKENKIDTLLTFEDSKDTPPKLLNEITLQPGKWQKSLNCVRRSIHSIEHLNLRKTLTKKNGKSTGVLERPKSLTSITQIAGNRKSICIRPSSNQGRKSSRSSYSLGSNNFKHQVLQRCGQRRILSFDNAYKENYLNNCRKIGEGAFGEVFVHSIQKDDDDQKTVLKIIPIEGNDNVNGEVQKTFEQILPEIIISMELCALSDDNRKTNITSGFVNIKKVRCVKGCYPSYLQKLWEEYDLEKESENDHPKCFSSNQQYIVLELAFSGQDLEGFQFKNAEQSFYALQQIILTLAVGENEYQFEHRDLHWGNVLALNTNQTNISYKLGSDILTIPSKGVLITIIDYTLSRMTFNDYCFYNDLSNDEELFTATGDYQFEIYRMMRKVLNNKWEKFEPKTNIFWISYIISKLIDGVSYKNFKSKNHLQYIDKLKQLSTSILTYNSCLDCARDIFLH